LTVPEIALQIDPELLQNKPRRAMVKKEKGCREIKEIEEGDVMLRLMLRLPYSLVQFVKPQQQKPAGCAPR